MPFSIDWYIKNQVIYGHFSGELDANQLMESLIQIRNLTDESSRPLVHIIHDVGDVTKAVSPTETLKVVREFGTHERTGWTLIVREKSFIVKMSVAFGTSVFKNRTRTFDTIADAEEFLKEIDSTINWENANTSVLMS